MCKLGNNPARLNDVCLSDFKKQLYKTNYKKNCNFTGRILRKKFNLVGPFFFTKTERSKHTSSKRKNRIKTRKIDLTPPKFNKHL